LWIEIEKKDALSFAGKGGGQIDGGSGLPYPTLLVGDGDYHSLHSGKLSLHKLTLRSLRQNSALSPL
jgi:hypothetical protein